MKSMLLRDRPECASERNSPNEIWSVYTVISWFSDYGGVSFASWELSHEAWWSVSNFIYHLWIWDFFSIYVLHINIFIVWLF